MRQTFYNNVVTVRGWVTGTNTGTFMGAAATNRQIKVSWLGVYKTRRCRQNRRSMGRI